MKRSSVPTGPARVRRPLAAAWVGACVMCFAAVSAPAQQGVAQPSPAAGKAVTRPALAVEPAPSAPARSPTSQPAASRSGVEQELIRRAAPANEPARNPTTSAASPAAPRGFDLARVLGALTLVLALIFVLRWVLRRSISPGSLPGATNAVQVLTRSPLSPRQQLLLVRVGRRLLVVSDCNGQLNPLSEITDPDEVAALVGQLRDEKLTSASRSFGNLMGMWRRGGEDGRDDEGSDGGGEDYPRGAPDVPPRGGDAIDGDGGDEPSVASARSEINGLVERVRLISHQFKRP